MPHLPDELVEEVFLRLPPDEPAALVRASLASNPWLGFLYSRPDGSGREEDPPLRFVSTVKFGARVPHFPSRRSFDAWDDCRHGRVLLVDRDYFPTRLVVWDPMTGCTRELYGPDEYLYGNICRTAVLCAVNGCDHRACHADPFKMVCVCVDTSEEGECVALAWVSLPEMGDWSKPSKLLLEKWKEPCPGLHLAPDAFIQPMPVVVVNDALYNLLLGYQHDNDRVGILKYSLTSDSLSLIDAPLAARADILIAMKDGSLGLAHTDRLTLHLLSRQIDSQGVASWTHGRVVDLKNLLPLENPKRGLTLIGSVECGDIVFVNTDLGIYEIDLKTLEWKERRKRENCHALIPYMSFYNPPERVIPGDAAH